MITTTFRKGKLLFILLSVLGCTGLYAQDSPVMHEVEPQQTLYSISRLYHVSVDDIKKWNGLKSNDIRLGQKLIVSSKTANQETKQEQKKQDTLPEKKVSSLNLYNQAISSGDQAFDEKRYDDATTYYKQAQSLNPDSLYSGKRLQEIENILMQENKEAEQNEAYSGLMSRGDSLMNQGRYADAKAAYEEALNIKPAETAPQNKINDIDALLRDQEAKEQPEEVKEKAYKYTGKSYKGTHFGIKVIPQSVWVFNKEDSDSKNFSYQTTWKMAVGVSADYHFKEKLGVGMELIYSQQGQNHEDYNGFVYKHNVGYIKMPITLNYNSNPEKTVMVYIHFGPQLAFLVQAKMANGEDDGELDVKDLYNKVNFGAVLGLGAAFNLPANIVISAGIRTDAGLTDAVNTGSDLSFLLSVDENGERGSTYNFTAGAEVALKYLLRKDRKKTKVIVY